MTADDGLCDPPVGSSCVPGLRYVLLVVSTPRGGTTSASRYKYNGDTGGLVTAPGLPAGNGGPRLQLHFMSRALNCYLYGFPAGLSP